MAIRITEIWRHPIKSHGRELLDHVMLEAGKTMPWDRTWGVAHEAAKIEEGEWARCGNFGRVAGSPELAAINASFDHKTSAMVLTHPRSAPLEFDPTTPEGETAFLDWVKPLYPEDRAQPVGLYSAGERGLTDSSYPTVSINSHASLRALSQKAGREFTSMRWRGNLWIDGAAPWEEFDWIDKELRIGETVLRVTERIERCTATHANPETGKRDIDMVAFLTEAYGHFDFGVKAEIVTGGAIKNSDAVTVL